MHSDFVQTIDMCELFHSLRSPGARNCLRHFRESDHAGLRAYRYLPPIDREMVRRFFALRSAECNFSASMLETLKSLEE